MKNNRNWFLAVFFLCFIIVGIPYWSVPYNQLNVPNGLYGPGLLVVVIAAATLLAYQISTFRNVVAIVGSSVPAVVFARIAWDVLNDPTTHNLWPIEIFLSLFLGLLCAFAGAITGHFISKLKTRFWE